MKLSGWARLWIASAVFLTGCGPNRVAQDDVQLFSMHAACLRYTGYVTFDKWPETASLMDQYTREAAANMRDACIKLDGYMKTQGL